MTVQKFFHSCLLLKKKGKTLLIDPGVFSFREGQISPEEVGAVDVILITHQHPDHFDPTILRQFQALGGGEIWTIAEIGQQLVKEGISYQPVEAGQTYQLAGFSVQTFQAEHGPLPIPIPENIAFYIDGTVLHPGDSYFPQDLPSAKVLALPMAGPWARLVDAVGMIDRLQPEVVIPIHDWVVKDEFLERMNGIVKGVCDEREITFQPLSLDDVLDNP